MNVRKTLVEILQQTIAALVSGEAVDWDTVINQVEHARQAALAQVGIDPGLMTSIASAANLLTDCARKVIDIRALAVAVKKLDHGPGWDAGLTSVVRKGPGVLLDDPKAGGLSAIHWSSFVRFFAAPLGFGRDKRDQDILWSELQKRPYHLPAKDVDLANPSGTDSSWVTDDGKDGEALRTADPTRDAYDALGLDWSGLFKERLSTDGTTGEARAVLLSCPLGIRQHAAGRLCCPNAIDGWGNLLFVPRKPTGAAWPRHGSATARPTGDAESLPEAIHGPARATGDIVAVKPLGYIRIGQRATECGTDVTARAIDRLREAVTTP
jgi:hypothetical protein